MGAGNTIISACQFCGERGTVLDDAGREKCAHCGKWVVRFPGEWD